MPPLTTVLHQLHLIRYEADEDSSTLNLTSAGDFANRPSATSTFLGAVDINTGLTDEVKVNGIEFFFCGGSAEGKTFTWKIFTWKAGNGPARQVAQGTGELGTQAVVTYPLDASGNLDTTATSKFWADKLVVSWRNWPKLVKSTDETGHNTVASVWCDTCGWRYWYVEIADADGESGTEAGDITVYYGYF